LHESVPWPAVLVCLHGVLGNGRHEGIAKQDGILVEAGTALC